MDRHRYYHTVRNQTKKDKYHMISLIFGILKKWYKCTYLQNRNRVTDVETKRVVTKGKRGRREKLEDREAWHCCSPWGGKESDMI